MVELVVLGVKAVGGATLGLGASSLTKSLLKTAIAAAPEVSGFAATVGLAGIGLGVGTGVGVAFAKNVDDIYEAFQITNRVIVEVQNAKKRKRRE